MSSIIWIETQKQNKRDIFDGYELESEEVDISLSGHFEKLVRAIEQDAIDDIRERILKVTYEISTDYTEYQNMVQLQKVEKINSII